MNPQGSSLARVRIGCRRQSACPSVIQVDSGIRTTSCEAPAGGVEPPIVALTGRRLTVRPHRYRTVGMAGFEPAISCSRSRRIEPGFPTSRLASAQRESNPHFRHGKAVGCRYIMGTGHRSRIVKETESTGWDSNPRRRITGAESSPLDDQCNDRRVGPEGLEPSPAWLRARRSATRALVPTCDRRNDHDRSRPGRSRTFVFRLSAECSPLELRAEGWCMLTSASWRVEPLVAPL